MNELNKIFDIETQINELDKYLILPSMNEFDLLDMNTSLEELEQLFAIDYTEIDNILNTKI